MLEDVTRHDNEELWCWATSFTVKDKAGGVNVLTVCVNHLLHPGQAVGSYGGPETRLAFLMIRFLCGAADGDGDDESFLAAVDHIIQGTPRH